MLPLLFLTAALAQHPTAPAQSAEDAAARGPAPDKHPSGHLRLPRAGEGYFSPDASKIIFQAYPPVPPSIFFQPAPNQESYRIYLADLAENATPKLVSTGKGQCTCAYFHPDGRSILFASSHLDPNVDVPRPRPRVRPTAARNATSGNSPSIWTFSRPTSTASTSSA